ncbi:unnamed protein product [Rotaria sordida]|nr:unnamed protein product [Rotaria sordida]
MNCLSRITTDDIHPPMAVAPIVPPSKFHFEFKTVVKMAAAAAVGFVIGSLITKEKQKISRTVYIVEKRLRHATALVDESHKQADTYKEETEETSTRVCYMKRREEEVTQMKQFLREGLQENVSYEGNPIYQRSW